MLNIIGYRVLCNKHIYNQRHGVNQFQYIFEISAIKYTKPLCIILPETKQFLLQVYEHPSNTKDWKKCKLGHNHHWVSSRNYAKVNSLNFPNLTFLYGHISVT